MPGGNGARNEARCINHWATPHPYWTTPHPTELRLTLTELRRTITELRRTLTKLRRIPLSYAAPAEQYLLNIPYGKK